MVAPDGGDLIQLPTQSPSTNSVERTAKLTLDGNGVLVGDVNEVRIGDKAWVERGRLREATKEGDRIRPIENILSASLTTSRSRMRPSRT